MTALLIIDMQAGSFEGTPPRHDADGVIDRINALSRTVRASNGSVIFIQHDGSRGDVVETGTDGWKILPALEMSKNDRIIHKTACDSFYRTDLQSTLDQDRIKKLIITGCATDFCVDTTVRAAASRDYEVIVAADGHTTRDRPHLDAASIILHHNWIWENLILPHSPVKVLPASEIINRIAAGISL